MFVCLVFTGARVCWFAHGECETRVRIIHLHMRGFWHQHQTNTECVGRFRVRPDEDVRDHRQAFRPRDDDTSLNLRFVLKKAVMVRAQNQLMMWTWDFSECVIVIVNAMRRKCVVTICLSGPQ